MSERLDDESMRITSELLREVRAGLAHGVNPEDGEPDDHKAVRTIEDEAVRARAAEAALVAEVRRLREALEIIRDTFSSYSASVVNGTLRVHVHTHVERVLG